MGRRVFGKVLGKCLSRLETLRATPPLFYNLIFYCASFWARNGSNDSKCENSILRKWVYSFKHSGNSRGRHRGPEIVSPDRRSGLKMGDFDHRPRSSCNFLKKAASLNYLLRL